MAIVVSDIAGDAESESEIWTEIETDESYRKRLFATDWGRGGLVYPDVVKMMVGQELDAVGSRLGMVRIHTHIAPQLKKRGR